MLMILYSIVYRLPLLSLCLSARQLDPLSSVVIAPHHHPRTQSVVSFEWQFKLFKMFQENTKGNSRKTMKCPLFINKHTQINQSSSDCLATLSVPLNIAYPLGINVHLLPALNTVDTLTGCTSKEGKVVEKIHLVKLVSDDSGREAKKTHFPPTTRLSIIYNDVHMS